MNISKIICRNFNLEVSGKRYNKTIRVALRFEGNGSGYTVNCSGEIATDCSSVTKKTKNEIMLDVVSSRDDSVRFGEFLVEILYQFKQITDEEQTELDVSRILTAFLKGKFRYNSDVKEELVQDMDLILPEMTEERPDGSYVEEAIVDDKTYKFTYYPMGLGFRGVGKVNLLEISYFLE